MTRLFAALAAMLLALTSPSTAINGSESPPVATPSPEVGYTLRPDLNHGSWVQGPTLPAPRQYAASAVLNGRIYLFGGFNGDHRQTDSTLVLEPGLVTSTPPPETQGGPIPLNLGTWQTAAPVPESVDNAAATAFQGYVYLAGGRVENKVTNKAWRYDPASDVWEEMRSMPVARHGASMQAVAGKLYLIGGAAAQGNDEVSIEVFDIARGTWSMLDNALATSRIGAATAVVNGKIAIVGGTTHDGRMLDSVEFFDPVRNRWTSGFHMRQGRAHFGLTTIENRLIAIGGNIPGAQGEIPGVGPDEPSTTQTMEISAGISQGWMSGPWMPFPRQGMSVVSLGNIVYVIGGSPWYGVGPVADVRRYVSPLVKVHFGPRTH